MRWIRNRADEHHSEFTQPFEHLIAVINQDSAENKIISRS